MRFIFCLSGLLAYNMVHAGIMPASSRVIYLEKNKEQSLLLANSNDYPIITQTWVDGGTGNLDQAKAPFVVLPPIFKMNPKGLQAIRLVHNGDAMPQDRESVYWLNLYEIPGKIPEKNQPMTDHQARLDVSMNTQLKVFYRPAALKKMSVEQITAQLKFTVQQHQAQWLIICQNPTPYQVSFTKIQLRDGQQTMDVAKHMDMMTPALSYRAYQLEQQPAVERVEQIEFTLLDDSGHLRKGVFDFKTQVTQLK